MTSVGEMSLEELKKFVNDAIYERLTKSLGQFEFPDEPDDDDHLSWDEVRALADKHRWTPPPGSKTSIELLREDRDS
jgi:hypothetical protein